MIQLVPPVPETERTKPYSEGSARAVSEERTRAKRSTTQNGAVGERAARDGVTADNATRARATRARASRVRVGRVRGAEKTEQQRSASYQTLLADAEKPPNTIGFDMTKYRILAQLRSIDISVKTHEKAHQAVLGAYAMGQTRFVRVRGPDGQFYAVGGSIKVNTQPIRGNPHATIRKARLIRMAALGPMNPSMQDMKIAVQAYRMEVKARRELAEEREEERKERAEKTSELRQTTLQKGRLSVLFPLKMPGNLLDIIGGDWRGDQESLVDLIA